MANSRIQFLADTFYGADSNGVAAGAFGGMYGIHVVTNMDEQARADKAVWRFNGAQGRYEFSIEYASAAYRPVNFSLNGDNVANNVLTGNTGGWYEAFQKWNQLGQVDLIDGENILEMTSAQVMPHIRTIRFEPA